MEKAGRHHRLFQAIVLLVLAIGQIATARLTEFLGVGQAVEIRSAVLGHPLVPWKYAFIIWGFIYFYSLVAAIWQVLPRQRHDTALLATGWNIAGVYLVNCIWQIWVPVMDIDWISVALIVIGLFFGINGLLQLKALGGLTRRERFFIYSPLALVTGWLTAAAFVNFTSAMLGTGIGLDPTELWVSALFLVALIAFGGYMVWIICSSVYAAALVWSLFWILMANLHREHEPVMVWLAAFGIVAVVAMRIITMVLKPFIPKAQRIEIA